MSYFRKNSRSRRKSRTLKSINDQEAKIKSEEEIAVTRIKDELNLYPVLEEAEGAQNEYKNLRKTCKALSVFEKKYSEFLSVVIQDIWVAKDSLDSAIKRKNEIDDLVQRKLKEESESLSPEIHRLW